MLMDSRIPKKIPNPREKFPINEFVEIFYLYLWL